MEAAAEPNNYSPLLGDWRCAKAVWVTGMNGALFPAPRAAHQVTTLVTAHRQTSFTTPSATALHLNASWRAARAAAKLKPTIQWKEAVLTPGMAIGQADVSTAKGLFDHLELAMTAAMSSFAAAEAFANCVVICNDAAL